MKDIKNYEGRYAITENGSIWSYPKKCSSKKGMWLKPWIDKHGYYKIDLFKNGVGKTIPVHRLLGLAFIHNPENKPCINHKDGNKLNNNLDNLEWCTFKYNNNHARENKLNNCFGETHPQAKLNDKQVIEIKKLLKENKYTHKTIGEMFNVKRHVISFINHGRSWTHIKLEEDD